MPKSRRPYPAEFRAEMVRLVRAVRTPGEFEPSDQTIRNWVNQAGVDADLPKDPLGHPRLVPAVQKPVTNRKRQRHAQKPRRHQRRVVPSTEQNRTHPRSARSRCRS